MTAQQKPAPLSINAFDIKEISARMQQRASEIKLHLPLSASLELAASVFGYNNYHEVAPLLKGQASLNIAGVNITGQMIEAVFAAYEKATGSKGVNLVVPASDPGGDFSYVVIKMDSSSFLWMLEQQLSGQTKQFEPTALYPSYAWTSEVSGSFGENPVQSFFYSSAHHKHDDGGGNAVSNLISSHRCFAEILFVLAQDYDPKQIAGLDRNELSKIIYTTNEIRFAGDDVDALEFLIDSADFAQIDENLTSLAYGDGHTLPAHSIFVQR